MACGTIWEVFIIYKLKHNHESSTYSSLHPRHRWRIELAFDRYQYELELGQQPSRFMGLARETRLHPRRIVSGLPRRHTQEVLQGLLCSWRFYTFWRTTDVIDQITIKRKTPYGVFLLHVRDAGLEPATFSV